MLQLGPLQAVCFATSLLASFATAVSVFEDNGVHPAQRLLEDGGDYFEYDISEFSLRFDKCQYVKMFDDELAEDEDSDSPLSVKHFVVFRLCPSDECGSCSTTFGRYVAELEEYLQATVNEQEKAFESMCNNCQERQTTEEKTREGLLVWLCEIPSSSVGGTSCRRR